MECNTREFVVDTDSLYKYFETIKDTRKKRGIRYSLPTVLLLIVLAKLCGEGKPYRIADWVKQRKEMFLESLCLDYQRMPHHSTYSRILELCESEIDRVVSEFLGKLSGMEEWQVIAFDGKTVRGVHAKVVR